MSQVVIIRAAPLILIALADIAAITPRGAAILKTVAPPVVVLALGNIAIRGLIYARIRRIAAVMISTAHTMTIAALNHTLACFPRIPVCQKRIVRILKSTISLTRPAGPGPVSAPKMSSATSHHKSVTIPATLAPLNLRRAKTIPAARPASSAII